MREVVWLWWSSGKDSAWALHDLRQGGVAVEALVTSFRASDDHVPMHEVAMDRVRRQAWRTGLPLIEQALPSPCPNTAYEAATAGLVQRALSQSVTHVAFGDLFLQDIRTYRERQFADSGLTPLFPLWGRPTKALAREMIAGGLEAEVVAVDERHLSTGLVGRMFDETFLQGLPAGIDPCGENGEFHTFVRNGPMLRPH
jgi:uncharacterized protein (TIGR00290 family)